VACDKIEVRKMTALNELLIAEATEYEFKEMLETSKPKSWLKSVSAFANCQGGSFHVILKNMNYDLGGDLDGTTMQVTMQDERFASLLDFCADPRTREEMQQHLGMVNRDHFRKSVLKPLLESGQLKMTIPDKPNSRNQRYIRTSNHSEDAEK
jgi:ATP-dependent DNA helicase RecG